MYKIIKALVLLFISIQHSVEIYAQEIPLWPDLHSTATNPKEKVRIAPSGDHVVWNIHYPSIKPYIPDKTKSIGAAVIIAPGGGHRELWIDHEGYNVAVWLKDQGIAAFVLKYRLSKDTASTYTVDGEEVSDMQQAIKIVRLRAKEWNINPNRIGVMGFSAGGEVAGLASMRFDKMNRPDFQALIYPGGIARLDTVTNAPPLFLLGGYVDREDISRGIAELYLKYKKKNIPTELHIYSKAGHGFGMRASTSGAVKTWISRFYDWLDDIRMISN